MKSSLLMSAIAGLFFFLLVPFSAHAQLFPQPGLNCGVAYPPVDGSEDAIAIQREFGNVPESPDLSNGRFQKYACCRVPLTGEDLTRVPPEVTALPGIGGIIEGIAFIANPLNFPRSLNPTFPMTVGDALAAILEFNNTRTCQEGSEAVGGSAGENSCYCKSGASAGLKSLTSLCLRIANPNERVQCLQCLGYDENLRRTEEGSVGVWTGLGCMKTSVSSFIQETVFGVGIGIAGIVALGCIIYAAVLLQISGTNTERQQQAREILTSCIYGLLLIIFSVFILQVIGVNILRLPEFVAQ